MMRVGSEVRTRATPSASPTTFFFTNHVFQMALSMRIAEIFRSRQGEGLLTGTESLFVRVSGCNLRCWYCDTPYTSWEPEGDEWSVDAMVAEVAQRDCHHVVITGGEPMLFAELVLLSKSLSENGHHITVETAGTRYLPVHCDLMSISPKMANSTPSVERSARWHVQHEQRRLTPAVVRRLVNEYTYQLKFVVDQPEDVKEIQAYLAGMPEVRADRVLLMPQGTTLDELSAKTAWLQSVCEELGFRLCPRKHIEWYGAVRGT